MNAIKLEIDGNEISFEKVWVHLQDPFRARPLPYRLSVPLGAAHQVFDPYDAKPHDKEWFAHIEEQVKDLGSFVLDGYIDNMKAMLGNTSKAAWEWVLATVDEVRQSKDAIEIVGRAVPFDPKLY